MVDEVYVVHVMADSASSASEKVFNVTWGDIIFVVDDHKNKQKYWEIVWESEKVVDWNDHSVDLSGLPLREKCVICDRGEFWDDMVAVFSWDGRVAEFCKDCAFTHLDDDQDSCFMYKIGGWECDDYSDLLLV